MSASIRRSFAGCSSARDSYDEINISGPSGTSTTESWAQCSQGQKESKNNSPLLGACATSHKDYRSALYEVRLVFVIIKQHYLGNIHKEKP